jgi:hypothetical protein
VIGIEVSQTRDKWDVNRERETLLGVQSTWDVLIHTSFVPKETPGVQGIKFYRKLKIHPDGERMTVSLMHHCILSAFKKKSYGGFWHGSNP